MLVSRYASISPATKPIGEAVKPVLIDDASPDSSEAAFSCVPEIHTKSKSTRDSSLRNARVFVSTHRNSDEVLLRLSCVAIPDSYSYTSSHTCFLTILLPFLLSDLSPLHLPFGLCFTRPRSEPLKVISPASE